MNGQSYACGWVGQGGNHSGSRTESHKMHRADFCLMAMPAFEFPVDHFAPSSQLDLLAMIEPHKKIEPLLHRVRIRQFDQERRAQLTGSRQQGVIDIQLLLDLLRIHDTFHPDHFLNLEP